MKISASLARFPVEKPVTAYPATVNSPKTTVESCTVLVKTSLIRSIFPLAFESWVSRVEIVAVAGRSATEMLAVWTF